MADDKWTNRMAALKYAAYLAAVAGWLVALAMAVWRGDPPPAPPPVIVERAVPVEKPDQFAALGVPNFTPTTGWVADADAIAANLDPERTLHFSMTPAGKAALGDEDVFLWQAVRKVNNKGPPWYPNVNQQSVGCCVGCGFKHAADVCQAMQIVRGQRAEWKPISVEVIYGGSRIEVGGGRISGDGSVGSWAAKWVKDFGVAPMERYGSYDLTTFSPARAREFGRKGVPEDIEKIARDHPVKGTALVTSWTDIKRAVQQGYPVAICSDQGFRMERDATGRCRPQGRWMHCMCVIAVRGGRDEGGFILNSWGDNAHTGPVWPADAPTAGFWADADVLDRIAKQGDSFALSDMQGFPSRKLPNWWVAVPARERLATLIAPVPVPFTRFALRTERPITVQEACERFGSEFSFAP